MIDLDGTLADSLGVMKTAYGSFLEGHAKKPSEQEFEQLNGPPLKEVVRRLQLAHDLPDTLEKLLDEYENLIDKTYSDVTPMPGVAEFLAEAKRNDWTTCIVTSNSVARSQAWLKQCSLAALIDTMVCGEDVKKGKPDPEPYLTALERSGFQAEEAIAIEDSPQGATAALAAGIETIGLTKEISTAIQWPDEVILMDGFFKIQNSIFHNDISQRRGGDMTLKQRLKNNETTIGSWITLGHSAIGEIMAKAGFDWLVIDMEHSVIELRDAQELMQAIELWGIPSIVRLTSNDENQIKRVMDAGAHGVMVPYVNSAADAERAVASVYYPPAGRRGVGLARGQGYGATFQDYRKWLDENGLVIVMIEHIDGVNAVDEILAVDGIDAYMIGPYDLSSSLGVPGEFDKPVVVEAIKRIREAGEKAGVPGGIHVVDPDLEAIDQRISEGFKFIGYGMDVRILDAISRLHLTKIRESL